MKFLGFTRMHGTYSISLLDENKMILNHYFIQFSFKEPYKHPHREEMFDNGSYIYGWLFFYFGKVIAK